MSKFLKDIGRYMSLLLRHKPEKEHLNINSQGYVLVDEIIDKLNYHFTLIRALPSFFA